MNRTSANFRLTTSRAIFTLLFLKVQSQDVVLPESHYYKMDTFSRADSFLSQNLLQYHINDLLIGFHIDNFRQAYEESIATVDYYKDLIDLKLRELENIMNLDGVKKSFATCKQKSKVSIESLIQPVETIRKMLKHYYANEFAQMFDDCKSNFADSELKYARCIVNVIKSANILTATTTKKINKRLSDGKCKASNWIKESFVSYTTVLGNIFTISGELKSEMRGCKDSQDFCSLHGCSRTKSEYCKYQMSWHLSDSDRNSQIIESPFRGINASTPCLQINFITLK